MKNKNFKNQVLLVSSVLCVMLLAGFFAKNTVRITQLTNNAYIMLDEDLNPYWDADGLSETTDRGYIIAHSNLNSFKKGSDKTHG